MMRSLLIQLMMLWGITATSRAQAVGSGSGAMDRARSEAQRWLAAKVLGEEGPKLAAAQLLVYTRTGVIEKNRRQNRVFLIAGQPYERGLTMPSPGEIHVRLPGPGATFEAVVGVDSNDLGHYSNAGRGSVVASVTAGGREMFQSGVLHEGLPGVPVRVELGGAIEFSVRLSAAGERSRTYRAEWDQADWADARVTLADGRVVWLADLPVGPLPGPY